MRRKVTKSQPSAIENLIAHLETELPPLLMRHRWAELSEKYGLPLSLGRMQNLDCTGQGPESMLVGGRVAYPRDAYLTWLRSRMGA
ncbi:MAG: hypothetical protein FD177_919 [Desulfovibrionaceae bacterium]|nr:MAG: hypothetical protein FD177_919 [Desulfovibrionaceae bacterium]